MTVMYYLTVGYLVATYRVTVDEAESIMMSVIQTVCCKDREMLVDAFLNNG